MAFLPRSILILSAGILASVAPTDTNAAPNRAQVGSIRAIHRGLSVAPPHRVLHHGRVGDPLFGAYRALTAQSQRATLRFLDGSFLDMNERTDIVIRSANLTLLRSGEIAMADHGAHHRVETATAVAGAMGTTFDVRISAATGGAYPGTTSTFPPGTTTVSVVAGNVVVSNPYGRQIVHAGEWTHVAPGKPPTRPTRHNARGDVVWTSGLPLP